MNQPEFLYELEALLRKHVVQIACTNEKIRFYKSTGGMHENIYTGRTNVSAHDIKGLLSQLKLPVRE